jgi:hypothetical protein
MLRYINQFNPATESSPKLLPGSKVTTADRLFLNRNTYPASEESELMLIPVAV